MKKYKLSVVFLLLMSSMFYSHAAVDRTFIFAVESPIDKIGHSIPPGIFCETGQLTTAR